MPRVLWLARAMPLPLDAGDRMYSAFLAQALGKAGADVCMVGLASPDAPHAEPSDYLSGLSFRIVPGLPASQYRALASPLPLVAGRFGTPEYKCVLDALLRNERWDAIVLDQYALVWALPIIRTQMGKRLPLIHVAHDFETQVTRDLAAAFRGNIARKAVLALNARRTAKAECRLAESCDAIVTLTQEDADSFRSIGAKGRFAVIPPGYEGKRVAERRIGPDTPRRVGIVGSYQWIVKQHNLTAFLDDAEALFEEADIELAIVGGAPDEFRRMLEARRRASCFLGYVDDLPTFLQSCRMGLVIEAVGGGFKLKVLDYVMTRTPVAGFEAALAGQADAVVQHCLSAQDGPSLCRKVIAAIDDFEQLNAMQDAAFKAASRQYDWAENGRRLLALIQGLA